MATEMVVIRVICGLLALASLSGSIWMLSKDRDGWGWLLFAALLFAGGIVSGSIW